jgi:transcriptional regulator with XRE-family HTH domain
MAQKKLSNKGIAPNEAGKGGTGDLTIDDIARLAGVSVSTVSRILNDKPDVALGTRQRVKQVMNDLGYSPHTLAQRLAVRRSRSIALVFPLGNTAGRAEVAIFIVKAAFAAEAENYLFSLVAAPMTESRLLSLYRSAQVEGVILMEIHMDDWRVELLKKYDYPFVMIGRCADNTGLSFVDLDFEAAIVIAVDHLVQLGHRHIAFFNSGALRQPSALFMAMNGRAKHTRLNFCTLKWRIRRRRLRQSSNPKSARLSWEPITDSLFPSSSGQFSIEAIASPKISRSCVSRPMTSPRT